MSIMTVWVDNDRTILRQVFEGNWTVESYRSLINRTHKLLNGLDHIVHVIQDHTESAGTPYNFLSAIRFVEAKTPPNQGIVVSVALDEFGLSVLPMAQRLAPHALRHHFAVETVDDALDIIERERDHLGNTRQITKS